MKRKVIKMIKYRKSRIKSKLYFKKSNDILKVKNITSNNNPKFIETLNNDNNIGRQYLDTMQFNSGKDNIQSSKKDEILQTNANVNYTM